MPSRKSTSSTGPADVNGDVSMISNATTSSTHAHPKSSRQSGGAKQGEGVSIDDLLLPRTLTSRLARGVLPANTQIQKDAVLAIAKSATVFISYLAHHANEQTSKKTIGPQDVLKALKEIEMDGVMQLGVVGSDGRLGGRLERELEAYEEIIKGKRKGYRDKVKARESLGDADAEDERGEPSKKKARRISGDEVHEDERMLEQQLNGVQGSSPNDQAKRNGNVASVLNGVMGAGPNEEADVDEADGTDADEGDEDDEEDDDEAGEDEDDHDDEADVDEAAADDAEELEERVHTDARSRIALMPDGNVDMGSEDESD